MGTTLGRSGSVVVIGSRPTDFRKLLTANSTGTDDSLAFGGTFSQTENYIRGGSRYLYLLPFGAGSDTNVINYTVYKVNLLDNKIVPILLATGTATLSSGIADGTDLYPDTIAVSSGTSSSYVVDGVANTTPAMLVVDTLDADWIYVGLDKNTATNANCLVGGG